jgi:hypothetical protein
MFTYMRINHQVGIRWVLTPHIKYLGMQTIREFDRQFGTDEQCKLFLVAMRWPDGLKCPRCRRCFIVKVLRCPYAKAKVAREAHSAPRFGPLGALLPDGSALLSLPS